MPTGTRAATATSNRPCAVATAAPRATARPGSQITARTTRPPDPAPPAEPADPADPPAPPAPAAPPGPAGPVGGGLGGGVIGGPRRCGLVRRGGTAGVRVRG